MDSARTRRVVAFAAGVLGLFLGFAPGLLTASAAGAETPAEVVEVTGDSGVYIGSTRASEFDAAQFEAAVATAARSGYAMIVIAPDESIPDDRAFALRVRQAADADIVMLFGEEGAIVGSVIEDFDNSSKRALDDARVAIDPETAANAYVSALTTELVRETPPIIGKLTTIVFVLLLVLGVTVFAELGIRQHRQNKADRLLEQRSLESATTRDQRVE